MAFVSITVTQDTHAHTHKCTHTGETSPLTTEHSLRRVNELKTRNTRQTARWSRSCRVLPPHLLPLSPRRSRRLPGPRSSVPRFSLVPLRRGGGRGSPLHLTPPPPGWEMKGNMWEQRERQAERMRETGAAFVSFYWNF